MNPSVLAFRDAVAAYYAQESIANALCNECRWLPQAMELGVSWMSDDEYRALCRKRDKAFDKLAALEADMIAKRDACEWGV
jgi:hypothetical protein